MTRNRINFTKAVLDRLPLPKFGRAVYLDTRSTGLQLRVTSSGAKTFSVYRRPKGGTAERVTVGRYPTVSIELARRAAAHVNAAIADHKNPCEIRRAMKQES